MLSLEKLFMCLTFPQRVYIFSGTEDTIVHPDVVKALEQQYRDFGVTQIQTVYNIGTILPLQERLLEFSA